MACTFIGKRNILDSNNDYHFLCQNFGYLTKLHVIIRAQPKNDKTGYGLAVTRGDIIMGSENAQLSSLNTVFQAEIYAIDRSCHLLRELNTKCVTIFSDSKSGLQAISGIQIKSKVVKNCVDSLNELGKTCKVELKWVKGHAGHSGNELADYLAKTGTTNELEKVDLPPPKCIAMTKISSAMYKVWNDRWISSQGCRQTKIFFPTLNRVKSKTLINLDRQNLGSMVQVLTGHNRLRYHESKISSIEVNSSCRFCQWEEETSWHLIGECPFFWRSRRDIFNETVLENPPDWNVTQLMKFVKKTKMNELLNPVSNQ